MPTNLSKAELATILSALDGQTRNPANRDKALAALERRATALGLTTDAILDAAPGLLDGRLSPADWLAEITDRCRARPTSQRSRSRISPCRSSPGASGSCWSTSPAT